ncbi:MAG: hypothetical protein JW750_02430 [Anaerolineaceae bacterium]|nr:hypothetical protein [Anaerolineaceae bacterium]
MKSIKAIWMLIILIFVFSACNYPGSATTANSVEPTEIEAEVVVQTATEPEGLPTDEPAATSLPEEMPTPTPEPTLKPFEMIEVRGIEANVNLRKNPGTLFDVVVTLGKKQPFYAIGQAPGGEWFLVMTPEHTVGWIFHWVLEKGPDLSNLPVILPRDVQVVEGSLRDANGNPITYYQFAVVQTDENGKEYRTDANVGADGHFYAYLPPDASGEWTVSYVAVSCESNTMNQSDCSCLNNYCGEVYPNLMTITLPLEEALSFEWR